MAKDTLTPETWLCSVVEMVNARTQNTPFKIIKLDQQARVGGHGHVTRVQILHRDSGAVWEFTCDTLREPV